MLEAVNIRTKNNYVITDVKMCENKLVGIDESNEWMITLLAALKTLRCTEHVTNNNSQRN